VKLLGPAANDHEGGDKGHGQISRWHTFPAGDNESWNENQGRCRERVNEFLLLFTLAHSVMTKERAIGCNASNGGSD